MITFGFHLPIEGVAVALGDDGDSVGGGDDIGVAEVGDSMGCFVRSGRDDMAWISLETGISRRRSPIVPSAPTIAQNKVQPDTRITCLC